MKKLLTAALLACCSFAFGATLYPIQLLNPAGSTTGQTVVSTGPSGAPAWGNISAAALAAQAANTVVANVTASSASPTAFAMPSCSTSNSSLQWSNGNGFNCLTGVARTGNPLSQFAATTSAQLAGVISDETGTGAAVFATGSAINPVSTGATTPGTGSFTTLAASGLITPTGGIAGVVNGSAAAAGQVGQVLSNLTTATSLTNVTNANATSVALTAGDWDCQGVAKFNPAVSTVQTQNIVGVSTTSATFGATGSFVAFAGSMANGTGSTWATPTVQINVSTSTTVFVVAQSNFSTNTLTVDGSIRCRRMH